MVDPGKAASAPLQTDAAAPEVIDLARGLALELHPHRRRTLRVDLDSALDRDLGLDSLGRVELLLRLERRFGVRFPERLLGEAETLRDVLTALSGAAPGAAPLPAADTARRLAPEAAAAAPMTAVTLPEVLDWHAGAHPERVHVLLDTGEEGAATAIPYRQLRDASGAVASGLRQRGLAAGAAVALMLPTSADFFTAFFGVLYAGGVPVPIYPPFRLSQIEDHLRRQARILDNAGAVLLITVPEAVRVARLLEGRVGGLAAVETVAGLASAGGGGAADAAVPRAADDVALLQYTSGSTGDPKGVVLSHANLLANIRAMGAVMEAGSSDVFVSWLPLYHDMGLIGAWLGSLYHAVPAVIIPPLRFLARPESWLWAIHRHRATLSAGPNFAYELCLRKLPDAALAGLDLSSWRMSINGAEPVRPDTVRRFAERFARHGLRPTVMAPCYGLAECSVGLAFPPAGRLPVIDRVDRWALTEHGAAVPAAADDPATLEYVGCGLPLPGHEIRIVDRAGRERGERQEGRLEFRGPSATRGYFRNPEKTAALFDCGWLETGDLAYLVGGEVFLTGRSKDIIIRAGRNIHPHEVEAAIGDLPGIRKGCVAVIGTPDPAGGTERLVVLAETRETDPATRAALRQRIDAAVTELLDAPADDVVLAPPHAVLKTSSGKIRRAACRELYAQGRFGRAEGASWRRLAWVGLAGLAGLGLAWREARRSAAGLLYAAWWWGVLAGLAGPVWLLVALLQRRAWRWAVVRGAARLMLRLTGTAPDVRGVEHLPAGGAVLVANHASYLDGLVLTAALPRPPLFVAKAELARQVVAGVFLRRLGTLFVERADAERGVEEVGRAVAAARAGGLVAFFPEATFTRMPGLMDFRLGAFRVAAEAGVPLVPVALGGTRSMLRGGQWFPRRGALRVVVAPPLPAAGTDWPAVLALRDATRRVLLGLVGEPDLAAERAEF